MYPTGSFAPWPVTENSVLLFKNLFALPARAQYQL